MVDLRPALARRTRAAFAALLVVLAVGGIPGSRLRSLQGQSPSAVKTVYRRDGAIDASVHDGAGGPALAGARVQVLAVIRDRAYLAGVGDTTASGEAHLADLPRGELWVLVDKVGHARASAHIALGAERRSLTFDLAPAHTLKVAVHDELSAPLVDAEVEIVSATDPLPVGARTGADGSVAVSRLGAGPWHLIARQTGFDDATARAENEGETVALVLHKLGALVVHVSQADDRDANHARVTVAGATLWPARSVETDDHGDVRIGNLGAGTYALRASRGDAVSPIEPAISVGRGEEAKVELRLAPGRFVNVRVTDGEGDDAAPIARARVTLAEGGLSPFPLEAATDAKGRARLGPIASGPVTVGARADGFVARGAIAIADAPTLETQVALVRAGVVTGRVVDARGDPVDGATIEIFGTDPMGGPILDDPRRSSFQAAHFDVMLGGPSPLVASGELGVMPGPVPPIPALGFNAPLAIERVAIDADPWVTRADGTFRASPASPGRIRALVRHPQFVEAQSDVVTLIPGGEVELQVVMHQGGSLEGRVVDSDDRPVPSALVFVSATRGTLERTTRTASDGTFAFAALPQSVTLAVSTDDDETPDVRMTLDVPEAGRQEVTVRLPAPRSPVVVTVVDERGASVVAAQVSGRSLSVAAPLRVTAFTDERGEAVLKRARGVPLRVEVTAPSRAPQFVVTDASTESVRVELAPAEVLTGEIVSARGHDPVAGAEVALHLEWGVRRARTDSEGRFALRDLPAGGARLAVRAPGFAALEEAVTVADSGGRRESNLDRIELGEEGVVEGEVVDGRGDPVTGARVARGLAPTWLLVGSTPSDVAVTDAQGRFRLRELAEGTIAVEAYSPDLGRGHVDGVAVVAGRTTDRVRVVIERSIADAGEPGASGGVAVTLGETGSPIEVVVVSVAEGSEAERGGVAAGDVLLAIDDSPVSTLEDARARLSGPIADDVVLTLRRADKTLLLRVARDAVRR